LSRSVCAGAVSVLVDRQVADGRSGEVLQQAAPMLDVLGITPTGCLRLDIELGALAEAQHVVVSRASGDPACTFVAQRINILEDLLALSRRQVACLRQGDVGIRAKPHPHVLAKPLVTKQARLGDSVARYLARRLASLKIQIATLCGSNKESPFKGGFFVTARVVEFEPMGSNRARLSRATDAQSAMCRRCRSTMFDSDSGAAASEDA